MAVPSRLLLCSAVVAVALLVAPGEVAAAAGHGHTHTRRLRPKKSAAAAAAKLYPANATRAEAIERQFTRWVRFVGGRLGHGTYNYNRPALTLLPARTLVVDRRPGAGDFTSIQAAVDSLPLINLARVVIRVNAGTYTEKVNISPMRAFVTVEGAGADKTVVQWGDTADTAGSWGRPMGTFGSATFAVNSMFFVAKNITFKNTAPVPRPGALGKQGVALRISADNAAFVGCNFLGAQDTLYDHLGRHYYRDCYIEGSVDFIFGNALSLYEGCHVHAIARNYGALTAQNRQSLLEDTGFSFVKCRVTGSGALYLGRAWGTFSRVVFAYTYMDNIIIPRGWYNWGDPTREMTVFYGQYKCTGPGANYAGRVQWSRELTDEEAKPFISLDFIDGFQWLRL
ncbi:probable pectinesterase 53 isoform X4 [Zea mays]|uniref:Pectinesterase n=1 Tax=Zea mays TaxID=4577 RepID=A0A1D6FU21_MAIZE|nr:probable pectinesterase 53 isoform X4 [Zea mays]AQK94974.1 putative pectinesterase 53 [Zea mays]AQK94977.1 putative pectinesterase 53 [Zea mays]|eukprot:XP_008656475.2 probable pectinesterase 53 isoform X4 [Zea mays]